MTYTLLSDILVLSNNRSLVIRELLILAILVFFVPQANATIKSKNKCYILVFQELKNPTSTQQFTDKVETYIRDGYYALNGASTLAEDNRKYWLQTLYNKDCHEVKVD